MKYTLLTALLGLSLTAHQSALAEIAVKSGDKIAFLGDSITQEGWDTSMGYVNLVIAGLEANGVKAEAVPAGVRGHKSDQMLARLEKDVLRKQPSWMTLSCGVNDVWHGAAGVPLDDEMAKNGTYKGDVAARGTFNKNISAIIGRASAAGVKPVILTTTVINENPGSLENARLAPYNEFLRQLAKERKLPLADLNTVFQERIKAENKPNEKVLTSDGVHMNVAGNKLMAIGILKALGLSEAEIEKAKAAWVRIQAEATALHTAELKLATPFSDHMVLQREKPVAVWGWADAGETVTVSFAGQSKSATAGTDGKWSLRLDALAASAESRTVVVTGKEGHKVEVKDVLVGEVWLGSGQSNMEFPVAGCYHFDVERAAAKYPLIRHYRESSGPSDTPQAEGKGAWLLCAPHTVGGFSAVLYFFGLEIHKEVGVPVGLINTSLGGTPIKSWVAAEVQSSDTETKANYDTQHEAHLKFDPAQASALHQKQLAIWKAASEQAKANGTPFVVAEPSDPVVIWKRKGGPSGLFNGKVLNLMPYTLRGMLWYQGERNVGNPGLYDKQLTQLVTSWRSLWSDELPFAWVQLPNFTWPSGGEGLPRMRESMLKTLALPKTGMAITIDIGDAKDIHPKNKQDVGKRLSFWALGTVYGKNVPAISGPLPAGSMISGNAITVDFKHANGGLKSIKDGPLTGFQIAAADQQWKPAEAKIVGETVVASSPEVPQPVAVRYAWKDCPDYSLANGAGLPASPFRTDDWPVPAVKK